MPSADAAKVLVEKTCEEVIEPIVRHVIAHARENGGRLDEGDQAAVRLLRSRERYLRRLWTSLHGTGMEQDIAKLELQINLDQGQLLPIGEKKHRVGMFQCPACDGTIVPDDDGFPLFVSKSRLCPVCEHGIQHAANLPPEGFVPTPVSFTTLPQEMQDNLVETSDEGGIQVQSIQFKPIFQCDNPKCGAVEERI